MTVEQDLKELRKEMKKKNPDGEKIFKLLCGDKYTEPIGYGKMLYFRFPELFTESEILKLRNQEKR